MKTSKSLVLAPAVAVAVSGLIAVPAFASAASTTPSESSDSIELPTDLPKAGPATVQPPQSPDGSASATESADASESPSASASEPPEAGTPEAILETDQVSQADIADKNKGIRFSGTGFTPEGEATVTVVGTEGTPYKPKSKLTVTEDGEVNGRYFFTASEGAKVPTGTYTLFLTDLKSEQESEKVEFEVVEKVDESASPTPTETKDATESASPTPTETATESATPAPTETTTAPASPTPSQTATESASPAPTQTPSQTPSATPSQTPSATPSATPSTTPSATPSATPSTTPETTETPSATPTAEAVDPQLAIDPTELTSEAFSSSDGGVTVSVTDAAPQSTVALTITHAQGKVSRFEAEKTVNAEGTAVFELHPEGKAVLGEYTVTVDVEGAEDLTGAFTVVTNGTEVERDDDEDDAQGGDSGEGSDSGDKGSDSGSNGGGSGSDNSRSGNAADLPRTGTELTGVALGAGLLVVGAAAVVLTRRRGASSDPAEN